MTAVDAQPVLIDQAQGAVYVNAQRHFLTISEELHSTYAFDREGRLLTAFVGGATYCRGLGGSVLLKRATPGARKERRWLGPEESHAVTLAALAHVGQLAQRLPPTRRAELDGWLDAILAWDAGRLQAERAAFQAAYRPVSILPPDQYRALVLQAAEGCSWNKCSFCALYRDRAFRIKTPEAFRQHVRQVKALLGRGLGMRLSVFLGDANALIIPQRRLLDLIAIARAELLPEGAAALSGIYAFLDIFGAEQKGAAEYAELREAGVRRVYIGLESGDAEVFRLLNKPGSPEACVEAVRAIKSAGIGVGIILLAGAGGASLARQHVAHSIRAVEAMGLGAGDIVYVSPLIVPDDGEYAERARGLQSAPLPQADIDSQMEEIKRGARAVAGGAKAALYHLEEFVY